MHFFFQAVRASNSSDGLEKEVHPSEEYGANKNIELSKFNAFCQWKHFFSQIFKIWEKKCIHRRNLELHDNIELKYNKYIFEVALSYFHRRLGELLLRRQAGGRNCIRSAATRHQEETEPADQIQSRQGKRHQRFEIKILHFILNRIV